MNNPVIRFDFGNGSELIKIAIGETIQVITFDQLKEIWKDLEDVDPQEAEVVIEYINADVYDDKVVCCAYVSEGQGGIVFVWDTSSKQIIHYSNGCFAIKAAIHNDMVYVLRLVSYWGVKAHLEFDNCKLGTKSCEVEPTIIPLPEEIANNLADDFDDYEISFDNHGQPKIIKE
jgi:hypothetical protein